MQRGDHKEFFHLTDIVNQLPPVFKRFYENDDLRLEKMWVPVLRKVDIHSPHAAENIRISKNDSATAASHPPGTPCLLRRSSSQSKDATRSDGKFFREIEQNCCRSVRANPGVQRKQHDLQVLSTVPVMFTRTGGEDGLELSKILNDHLAEILISILKDLLPWACLQCRLRSSQSSELERCMKQLGFAGMRIRLPCERLEPERSCPLPGFRRAAEALGASILVHPWDMMGESQCRSTGCPGSSREYQQRFRLRSAL